MTEIKIPVCKFNDGVGCPKVNRECRLCGWNPEVAADRFQPAEPRPFETENQALAEYLTSQGFCPDGMRVIYSFERSEGLWATIKRWKVRHNEQS